MPAVIHPYEIQVSWSGGRDGTGVAETQVSQVQFPLSVPTEFQGPGVAGNTNPEEMFTATVASCYAITFGIIAANRKLPVASVSVTASGEVEQNGASFKYKRITLRPSITVSPGTDPAIQDEILNYAIKTDQYCIIGNAIRGLVEIVIAPTIG
jgi:peroxiredoxin-like protein